MMRTNVLGLSGEEASEWLSDKYDFEDPNTLVLATSNRFNIIYQHRNDFQTIVNLQKINEIRYINTFFETVNHHLKIGGTFIGCVETSELRGKRLLQKFPFGISQIYFLFDYIFKRVFPKLPITRWFYYFITDGRNRVISKYSALGRLVYAGFSIKAHRNIGHLMFFVAQKERDTAFDEHPSMGPIFTMDRVGKGGQMIKVYKLRTMYTYSEYLQGFMFENNNLKKGGKIANDERITLVGKIMRRVWLDEFPMIINLMKGEIKLVGVRPLSRHFYNLYTPELQQKRILVKPGFIPPFYADMPKNLIEIMDSESRYVDAYLKNPIKTDLKYFFKALKNVLFGGARSE